MKTENQNSSRRNAIKKLAGTAALTFAGASLPATVSAAEEMLPPNLKGKVNHSVCRWCYNSIPLEAFCVAIKNIGFKAIDLVGPKDWPVLQRHGIYSSMCNGAEINLVDGWNDSTFHAQLIKNYTEMIPLVSKAGYKQLICFSGNRRQKDDETGWKNCEEGLKKIMAIAERNNVTLVMELLNSKVDHKDYQCDKTAWGVELAKRIGSENFKLLYDIYHMQIDEGDVIRTIRDNHQYISHYHTGGVPGRNEIDETQELNYPAIVKAILETGFKGYIAQEFIPKREDKIASLKQGVLICDV